MGSVVYEARRQLAPGHGAGTSYPLDFDVTKLSRPSGKDLKVSTKSMSGQIETLFFGTERVWSITTAPVRANSAEAALLIEFLASTADGQEFTFDPYGTDASPVRPMQVIREDNGYTEAVFQEIDGIGDAVAFTFSVRES